METIDAGPARRGGAPPATTSLLRCLLLSRPARGMVKPYVPCEHLQGACHDVFSQTPGLTALHLCAGLRASVPSLVRPSRRICRARPPPDCGARAGAAGAGCLLINSPCSARPCRLPRLQRALPALARGRARSSPWADARDRGRRATVRAGALYAHVAGHHALSVLLSPPQSGAVLRAVCRLRVRRDL